MTSMALSKTADLWNFVVCNLCEISSSTSDRRSFYVSPENIRKLHIFRFVYISREIKS